MVDFAHIGQPPPRAPKVGSKSTDATPDTGFGKSNSAAGGVYLKPRGYSLTMPDDDDIYGVKEEQLTQLVTAGRSLSLEISLLCAGAILGYAPSVYDTVVAFNSKAGMSTQQAFLAVFYVALVVLAVAKYFEHRNTKAKIDVLEQKIRSGQKLKIKAPDSAT
jgi:hypothetical protein